MSGAFWIPPQNRRDVIRLRYLCRMTTGDGDTQNAAANGKYPFFIRSMKVLTSDSYFFDGEGILIPGEGDVGEIFHHHCGRKAVHQRVYLLSGFKRASGRYLYFALQGTFRFMVDQGTAKTTVASLRLPMLSNFPVWVPPLSTQRKIATYLDRKTAAIDALIEKKRRLLELLAEERTALINQAVTKGLEPDVCTKERQSQRQGVGWNVSWVLEIPISWTVVRMKQALRLMTNRNEDGRIGRLLSLSVAKGVIPKIYSDESQVRSGQELSKYWVVQPGQFIVNPMWMMNGSLGASNIHGVISPDYRVYDPENGIEVKYLHYLLKIPEYQELYALLVRGNTTYDRRISKDSFNDLPLIIPPLSEQKAITDFLDRRTAHTDGLSDKLSQHISKLTEYRQALITAAVTGQIDIEEAA